MPEAPTPQNHPHTAPTRVKEQVKLNDQSQTSVLSDYDKISMLDIMADWSEEVPPIDESAQSDDGPWMSTQTSVADVTSVHRVPAHLLSLEDDEDTMNTSREDFIRDAKARAPSHETPEDPTMEISLGDFIAQHQPSEPGMLLERTRAGAEIPETVKLAALSASPESGPTGDASAEPETIELEFVAAVDQNHRLFVPLHLFEEGTLKPGMRLLIKATVLK